MNINETRQCADFTPVALSGGADELYNELYGDIGKTFIEALKDSPQEIAVISRFLAYIDSNLVHMEKGDLNG